MPFSCNINWNDAAGVIAGFDAYGATLTGQDLADFQFSRDEIVSLVNKRAAEIPAGYKLNLVVSRVTNSKGPVAAPTVEYYIQTRIWTMPGS